MQGNRLRSGELLHTPSVRVCDIDNMNLYYITGISLIFSSSNKFFTVYLYSRLTYCCNSMTTKKRFCKAGLLQHVIQDKIRKSTAAQLSCII